MTKHELTLGHRHYLSLLVVAAVVAGGAAVFVAIRPFGAEDNCSKQMKQRRIFFFLD